MKKVCILGGGASALMCACFAKEDVDVVILEQNAKLGKKILATGNGKCNLTNLYMNKCSYNQDIAGYLNRFNQQDTIAFFNSIGLEVYADDEGRVYPFSNTAVSVVDVLNCAVSNKSNIKFVNEYFVDLQKCDNGFMVITQNNSYYFDEVIVALGNSANLNVFEKLGLCVTPFLPSLCALGAKVNKKLAGVRISNVMLKCPSIGFSEMGEVLFRQDGISGIVVFNLSARLARKRNYNAKVFLDLAPSMSIQELQQKLKNRQKVFKKCDNYHFLSGFFNNFLNLDILSRAKIDLDKKVEMLSQFEIDKICNIIKNFEIEVTCALNNNQVVSGGVALNELDDSLQSKNVKGLYFIGEVVDVDGVCGGYNLQWAWTSGKIVGESL